MCKDVILNDQTLVQAVCVQEPVPTVISRYSSKRFSNLVPRVSLLAVLLCERRDRKMRVSGNEVGDFLEHLEPLPSAGKRMRPPLNDRSCFWFLLIRKVGGI